MGDIKRWIKDQGSEASIRRFTIQRDNMQSIIDDILAKDDLSRKEKDQASVLSDSVDFFDGLIEDIKAKELF